MGERDKREREKALEDLKSAWKRMITFTIGVRAVNKGSESDQVHKMREENIPFLAKQRVTIENGILPDYEKLTDDEVKEATKRFIEQYHIDIKARFSAWIPNEAFMWFESLEADGRPLFGNGEAESTFSEMEKPDSLKPGEQPSFEINLPADLDNTELLLFVKRQSARGNIKTRVIPDRLNHHPIIKVILRWVEGWRKRQGYDPIFEIHDHVPGMEVLKTAKQWGLGQLIYTVDPKTYSKKTLRKIIQSALENGANGLLVVDGNDPLRKILEMIVAKLRSARYVRKLSRTLAHWIERLFIPMDSLKILDLIRNMQRERQAPWELVVWIDVNPHKDSIEYIEEKVRHLKKDWEHRRIERILVQPRKFDKPYDTWLKEAQKSSLLKGLLSLSVSPETLKHYYSSMGVKPMPDDPRAEEAQRSFSAFEENEQKYKKEHQKYEKKIQKYRRKMKKAEEVLIEFIDLLNVQVREELYGKKIQKYRRKVKKSEEALNKLIYQLYVRIQKEIVELLGTSLIQTTEALKFYYLSKGINPEAEYDNAEKAQRLLEAFEENEQKYERKNQKYKEKNQKRRKKLKKVEEDFIEYANHLNAQMQEEIVESLGISDFHWMLGEDYKYLPIDNERFKQRNVEALAAEENGKQNQESLQTTKTPTRSERTTEKANELLIVLKQALKKNKTPAEEARLTEEARLIEEAELIEEAKWQIDLYREVYHRENPYEIEMVISDMPHMAMFFNKKSS